MDHRPLHVNVSGHSNEPSLWSKNNPLWQALNVGLSPSVPAYSMERPLAPAELHE